VFEKLKKEKNSEEGEKIQLFESISG